MNVSISAAKTANINEPVYLFSRSTWKRKKPKAAETTTAKRSDVHVFYVNHLAQCITDASSIVQFFGHILIVKTDTKQ